MSANFIPRNEFKDSFDAVLSNLAKSGDEFYVTDSGRPTAVVIDVDKYHAMMDMIEAGSSGFTADAESKLLSSILKRKPDA